MKHKYAVVICTRVLKKLTGALFIILLCVGFLPTQLSAQENCSNAQYLGAVSGSYSGTTVGAADDISACRTGYSDKVFYFTVANGSTIDIWEPTNGYDEWEYLGYGATCPGTQIQCWDNDALAHTVWTNNTGSSQNVWWIQDAYSGSGTFSLQWTITTPLAGENCATAQNLGALTSPYSATTVGYADDISTCRTGYPDRLFYIDVANCRTLDIWESTNGYDEWEYIGYGATCPGTTTINCWDNDGLAHTVWNNSTGSTQRVWYVQDAYSGSGTFTLNWSVTCPTPAQPSAITGTTNPIPGSTQTYSVTAVGGITYTWSFPSGWTITGGQGTSSVTVTVGTVNGTISVTPSNCCGSTGTAQTLATNIPAYRAQFISSNIGSTNWCPGESRSISVIIKNTGTATWNTTYTTNVGVKWNTNGANWTDYHVRVNAGSLASGNQTTYNLTIQAKNATAGPTYGTDLAAGSNNLTFDVVNEGNCWFGGNGGACGPGNAVLTTAAQTIQSLSVAPTGITGTTSICVGQSTTLTLSGGSAGSGAVAQWFTGSCGGTSAGTGNSITVSPSTTTTYYVRYSGTCNTTGCTSGTTVNVATAPGPGSNVWNVLCYSDNNFTNYSGYYTENRMAFDSYYRWGPGSGPSSANALTGSAYSGCSNVGTDNHSYIYSRTGFPAGTYSISVNRDDDSELKINGTSVYNTAGWNFFTNVWTGTLNSGTTVEYKVREYGGNSYGGLVFNYVTVPSSGNNSIACGTNCTLMDHQGISTNNSTNYSDGVNGYTVLNNTPTSATTITLSGSFYVESCCDRINIYDGVGTSGTLLAQYGSAGSGTFSYTGLAGQTLTVQFTSDGSVNSYGFIADVVYTGDCSPGNNNCANAINVSSLPYTSAVINNQYATDDNTTSTCDGPYKNVWWKVTGVCGTMTAITCTGNTNFDDEIAVFTGSCGSFTQVTCNDDNGAGCTSNYAGVSWTSTAGTPYYISVGSYYNAGPTGNLQLQVTGGDATAPTLSNPGNQSLNTPSNGCTASYTIVDPISDNCTATWGYSTTGATTLSSGGNTIADGANSSSLSFNKGVTTVTLTGTDGTNAASTVSFTITVTDNLVPTISGCPANIAVNTNAGVCTGTATWTTSTWTDNCLTPPTISGASYLGTNGGNYYYFVSSAGITWTAANADAIAKGGRLVTIETATENTFLATALGANFPVWLGYSDAVTEGNFVSVTGVPLSYGNGTPNSYGAYANWNGAEPNDAGGEDYVNMNAGGSWNDLPNSYGSILGYVLEYGLFQTGGLLKNSTNYPLGVTTNTYNAYDFAGNASSTCSFTVTVTDNQDPTFTCSVSGTQNVNTASNACTYTHGSNSWNPTGMSDNCSVASTTCALTGATIASSLTTLNGQAFNTGTTTVTWTIKDGSNRTATCSFTVVVTDATNPTITCGVSGTQNVNTASNACTYTHGSNSWNPSANADNCAVTSLTAALTGATTASGLTTLNGQVFNTGTTTVTWTAKDAANNQATCSFTVVVTDATNPTITCGVSGTQNVNTASNACTYTHGSNSWNPSANADNCAVTSLTAALTGATTASGLTTLNGQAFNTGTTTVTWTAKDASNNQATCSFTVVVADATNPTITCGVSGTQNVNTASNACTYTHGSNSWNPSANADNCAVTSLTAALTGATTASGLTTLNGQAFNTGTTTVTWTAKDAANNQATCSFTVVVTDATNPTITCGVSGTQNVNTASNACTYTHGSNSWNPSANADNCSVTSLTAALTGATTASGLTTLNGQAFNTGTTTVTWTAKDAANNQATCSFTVVVTDITAPVITTCPANQTVLVSANCQATIPNYATLAATPSTDNCTSGGSLVFTQSPVAGTYAAYGTNVVTITVKDAANNQVTCNTNFIYTGPTDVVGASSSNTCVYAGLGTGDKYLVDATTNEALVSINEGAVNLGTVTATVTKHGSVPTIANSIQCDAGAPPLNGPSGGDEMYLPREFDVTTTASYPLSNPVTVSLYFTQAELSALSNATVAASTAYQNCWGTVASNGGNLMLTIDHGGGQFETRKQGGFGLTIDQTGPNGTFKATFQVNRFSGFKLHGNGGVNGGNALPVEFLYFTANAVNNSYVKLEWATALEINNDGFEIQRSVDGNNWSVIGWVDGNDNSTVQINYSYNDYTVEPNNRYYYRLRQVDNDGQFAYSNIDDAIITNGVDFVISEFIPNPTTAQTQLIVTSSEAKDLTISVYDILGQKVSEGQRSIVKGVNRIDFDFGRLAAGNYSVAVTSGNNVYTKRLVVTR